MAFLAFKKPRSFLDKIKSVFNSGNVKEYIDDIEEALVSADVEMSIVSELTENVKNGGFKNYEAAENYLKKIFAERLSNENKKPEHPGLMAVILAGVNGAGKTTTAAKLARYYGKKGRKAVFAAADTFRAAAPEQIRSWAEKLGVEIVSGAENADPASVAHDAVVKAKNLNAGLVIIDTAGRLHTKSNLMQELQKIKRVVLKELPKEAVETLIAIDANTGKNAFLQAKEFNEAVGLDGVILTKFDSSARGGSILHIKTAINIPVKFITFGEGWDDMEEFDPAKFAEEFFGK